MVNRIAEISKLEVKENGVYRGIVATTHLDKVGDVLSKNVLLQIKDKINDTSKVSDGLGAYRSISKGHDWIRQNNPELDEVAFFIPGTATVVELEGGHFGVESDFKINEFYRGDMTTQEIKERIANGHFVGLSIEYDVDESATRKVSMKDTVVRYIDKLKVYAGAALARARLIANPNCTIVYKEVETLITQMAEETKTDIKENKAETPAVSEQKIETQPTPIPAVETQKIEEKVEQKEKVNKDVNSIESIVTPSNKLGVKEFLQSKEFKDALNSELEVRNRVLKVNTKEETLMDIKLSIKEMKDALSGEKVNINKFNDAASLYFKENAKAFEAQIMTSGLPINTTLQVKCDGTKLRIVDTLEVKDTLDTTTNTSSYTQSNVEFGDLYLPGLVETFNTQNNYFGTITKVQNLDGTNKYGWKIKTVQNSGFAIDPDDSSVNKQAVKKLKLQTDIKEYRAGVSVSDYTLKHSRGTFADLFQAEVQSQMRDMMKELNKDLITEQTDSGIKVLGLEAVADSAGNTTLYGLTRSTANRLAPDSATNTYVAVGGAVTEALVRTGARLIETEGASRGDLRILISPKQRDAVLELKKGNQYLIQSLNPQFGFYGQMDYDGIPMIVDPDVPVDALFIIDSSVDKFVISEGPTIKGLAKIGAAEEAYISLYGAHVYEQPRRIHMLDTLS